MKHAILKHFYLDVGVGSFGNVVEKIVVISGKTSINLIYLSSLWFKMSNVREIQGKIADCIRIENKILNINEFAHSAKTEKVSALDFAGKKSSEIVEMIAPFKE